MGPRRIDVTQQHDKLLSAEAKKFVMLSKAVAHAVGHENQHLVPIEMSEAVVHAFEVIDIDDGQPVVGTVAGAALDRRRVSQLG